MTYCVGMKLNRGVVMISDSRTNASVDDIATFRKMTVWEEPGSQVVVLLTAGNLAITQSVVNLLDQGLRLSKDSEKLIGIRDVTSMFDAARLVGSAVREVFELDGESLKDQGIEFQASFLLGGQIGHGSLRLFRIYEAGNFIEATEETPFFQIGESKYGKPILDRALSADSSLTDAVKVGLLSMDSTLRSNLSVGLPIDVAVLPEGERRISIRKQIQEDDNYFLDISGRWSKALQDAYRALPDPPWC